MDRDTAFAEARRLAEQFDWGTAEYRQAASFRLDDSARSFVELEGGGPATFAELIQQGPYHPYRWVVRHFREGEPHEVSVRFRPDGAPYGYRELLAEDAPGAALDADVARQIGENSIGAPWNVDLDAYELAESSRTERPGGRVDHTFVYERTDVQAGEGRYRLRVVVSGDRPTELTYFLEIPEGFNRRYEQMRSANNGIAGVNSMVIVLLYGVVGIGVGLFMMLRRRWVLWRTPLVLGLTVAGLQALAGFNQWPLAWMQYDTAVSQTSFAIQQLLSIFGAFLLFTGIFTLSFMAAESLSRRAFPHHPQLWRCWSRDGARSASILGQSVAGYLAAGFMLAFLVAFYWVTIGELGWWSPSDTLNQPDSLATVLPWLNPLAISLQAGFWEECLFRAVPLAGAALLGERFGRRRAWIVAAFVLQVVVFGAAHASYPTQPAYARLVELIVPSAAFGLLYLRFGLLPAIIMHFAYDAVLFSIPLFLSNAPGAWIDQGIFVAIFLVPLWVVLVARIRGGNWIELPAQLRNGAWRPADPKSQEVAPQPVPVPRQALPPVTVAIAVAVAGFGLWLWATATPGESPALTIGRSDAVQTAREALSSRGVELNDWMEFATVAGDSSTQHRFVWSETEPATFRALLGRYLSIPRWRVRYAQFEGDVEARAEEYIVRIDGDGSLWRLEHRLPEGAAGAMLAEDGARSIARSVLAQLDGATDLIEVSARSNRRPARTDWTFTYRDDREGELQGGEARVSVVIAGDEVVDIQRFVFLPEQWERENDQRQTALSTARTAAGFVLWLLLFAGGVVAVVRWTRGRFNVRAALAIGGLLALVSILTVANSLPSMMAGLSTAQPLALQIGMLLAGAFVGGGFLAALLGLLAGHMHACASGVLHAGRTSFLSSTLAIGLGYLGASATVGAYSHAAALPWSSYAPAASHVPWLAAALAPLSGFIALTLTMMLIVTTVNSLTSNWTRRRVPATLALLLVGTLLAPRPATDDVVSWVLTGAVGGIALLAAYVWVFRGFPALVILTAAALSLPDVLATGMERAYNGALAGSALGAVLIAMLAWQWFERLTANK